MSTALTTDATAHKPSTELTSNRSTTRIHWIDIAKGIGIILVSFGHIRNGDEQSVWLPALDTPINFIYLFHMPLFFFLGGLTFSSRRSFPDFLKRKAQTLLIPYYVFSLYFLAKPLVTLIAPGIASGLQANHDYTSNIWMQFYDVLINGSGLWFLWAYFIGELIAYPLDRKFTTQYQYVGSGLALIAVSLTLSTLFPNVILPFRIFSGSGMNGLEVAGFILLGIACKKALRSPIHRAATFGFFVVFTAVFVTVAVIGLSMESTAGRAVLDALAMFAGVAAAVFLSKAITHNSVLEYIGRHSLSFYVVNALTLNVGKMVFFRVLHIDGAHASIFMQWVWGILLTIFCLALLAAEDILIRAFIPWSLGMKRKKSLRTETDTI